MVELTIPNEWAKVNISDIADVDLGKTPKKSDYLSTGDYKVVKFRDVDYSGIDWSNDKDGFVGERSIDNLRELTLHDVLITASAHSSEHIGRKICFVAKLPKDYQKIYFCGELLGISSKDGFLSPKFCFYYFLSHTGYKEIQSHVKGVHLTSGQARNMSIPFTPQPEQNRIIEIVEELFSDLDNAIENLRKAQEQLKVYKQVVLKNAFEGKFTKEWRKDHNPESAEEILRHLSEIKMSVYEKNLVVWKDSVEVWAEKNNGSKRPPKPKLPKELPCLKNEEIEDLPELPKQWKWIKIDKPLEPNQHALKAGPFGSSLKKSCYVEKGYKIYGQEQVISGDPYYGDYYISEKKYNELYNCRVKPGDVLVSLVGTAGKVLVLPLDIVPGIINPRLIKISFSRDAMLPKFFKYYFESSFSKSIYKLKAHGATMDILNVGIIQELPFPFCSVQEQEQVVFQIEARFSIYDKLEESVDENLQKAEALRQSILKQAFEGKLTEQWRKDHKDLISGENSAEALLKKIKAEKEALQNESKGKNKHD